MKVKAPARVLPRITYQRPPRTAEARPWRGVARSVPAVQRSVVGSYASCSPYTSPEDSVSPPVTRRRPASAPAVSRCGARACRGRGFSAGSRIVGFERRQLPASPQRPLTTRSFYRATLRRHARVGCVAVRAARPIDRWPDRRPETPSEPCRAPRHRACPQGPPWRAPRAGGQVPDRGPVLARGRRGKHGATLC